jgi:hypothetical protein
MTGQTVSWPPDKNRERGLLPEKESGFAPKTLGDSPKFTPIFQKPRFADTL